MKLNFGKRLVLFLHVLFSLLICAFLVAVCISPQIVGEAASLINSVLGTQLAEIVGIAVLVIYVLLAAMVLMTIFGGNGKRSERGFITVDSSESGRTRIAVGAVDQMIRQAVRSVDGITDMKARITNHQDSISISCGVGVASGVHVPTITMNIQRAIRSYIELNCGVAVREVSVNVHSMADAEGKGKKKGKGNFASAAAPAYAPAAAPEVKAGPEIAPEPEIENVPELEIEVPEVELPEIEPITLTLEVPEEMAEAAEETEEPASEE